MTALPTWWAIAPLGALVSNLDSQRVPVNAKERTARQGDVPYFGAAGQVGWIDTPLFDEPLLLLGEDGVQFFEPERRKAYMISGPSWVNNHAHVLGAHSGVNLAYLMHYLNQFDYRGYANGTTRLKLTRAAMDRIPVAVAPAAEQERIVAAIEEAFSLLDAGETALHNTRTRLKRMRDSVLIAAVTGQLVPQDPTGTPADKLLAGLGVSSTADVSELPAVPPSWAWARLGELAEVVGGVTKDAKRQGDTGNVEVPYLRVANVQRGYLDLTAIATIRVPEAKATQLALHAGDVLFNEGGDRDKLGRGWVWDGQIPGCIHQNHVYRARLADGIEPRFVSWWGNTFGRGWFEFHGKQTTNLASINLTTLKSFPVPLPPLEEQSRIVAEVERLFSFIEAAERAVEAGLARSKGLRRSVLKAAFEGRLVEQDPSDEPASVLLGRIAAERATVAPRNRALRAVRGKVVAS
ncbi:MAG: restriction endonuclease subunit S [Propionicimonas sp.]